ncbi:MAG: hypothetical protein A3A51_00980 [Candidatus Levybacteria bacterium RIFCSPLOWO2_01_FULL_39_10]|nr:MAG: hypothetical protein A3A51_00980 [Candidatus Levybacteria bacterium RIFCSPLOWO2_01_FULL_39_10]
MTKTGAIILAAGKGKRMKSKISNKVTMKLGDKPMVMHAVELLEGMKVIPIVIVVGFAKDSVKNLFDGSVVFAEQKKRLGTAHAAHQGVKVLSPSTENVYVLNGDDSAFYTKDILEKLYKTHEANRNAVTILTLKVADPGGLGRIIRGKNGEISAIVEEKDATDAQRKISEINPGCYLFSVAFLKKYLPKVKKSSVTKEYYLVSLIDLAVKNGEKVDAILCGNIIWRGVNTKDELETAEKLFKKHLKSFA